jgi:PKHD-type hydroxylase
MILGTHYYYFKNAIPDEICDRIIKLGLEKIEDYKSQGKRIEAATFGDKQKDAHPDAVPANELLKTELKDVDFYERDSKVAWFNEQWLYDLVQPFIHEANVKAGWNWQWDYSEMLQFTIYEPGGFYTWHTDGPSDSNGALKRYLYGITDTPLKPDGRMPEGYVTDDNMVGKIRKLSMTISLNSGEEYEGGDLKFDIGAHTYKDNIICCNEMRQKGSLIVFPSFLPHCVAPITKGTRYSLVLWSLGQPWK